MRTYRYSFLLGIVITAVLAVLGMSFEVSAVEFSIQGGAEAARGTDHPAELFGEGAIFQTITNILLFLIGAIAVIMLVIGGIRYVVSGGDQGAVTAAKNTILYAIVGIVVAFLAYAAVNFVIEGLSGAAPSGGGGSGINSE